MVIFEPPNKAIAGPMPIQRLPKNVSPNCLVMTNSLRVYDPTPPHPTPPHSTTPRHAAPQHTTTHHNTTTLPKYVFCLLRLYCLLLPLACLTPCPPLKPAKAYNRICISAKHQWKEIGMGCRQGWSHPITRFFPSKTRKSPPSLDERNHGPANNWWSALRRISGTGRTPTARP